MAKQIGNKDALLAVLQHVQETAVTKRPDEFTLLEFVQESRSTPNPIGQTKARGLLLDLEKQGVLSSRFITVGQARTKVYKKV